MGVTVTVLYFGEAQDKAGIKEEKIVAEDTSSLRNILIAKYPALARVPFRLALNRSLLKEESSLSKGDIIAVLPPFQGG